MKKIPYWGCDIGKIVIILLLNTTTTVLVTSEIKYVIFGFSYQLLFQSLPKMDNPMSTRIPAFSKLINKKQFI